MYNHYIPSGPEPRREQSQSTRRAPPRDAPSGPAGLLGGLDLGGLLKGLGVSGLDSGDILLLLIILFLFLEGDNLELVITLGLLLLFGLGDEEEDEAPT